MERLRDDMEELTITDSPGAFPSDSDLSQYLNWLKTAYAQHKAAATERAKVKVPPIADMWEKTQFTETSKDGISALLGWKADGKPVEFALGDDPPHTILAGSSGAGKSNVLHVLIHGLLHRYSPDELNLYLLDYKDGVEFRPYATANVPQIKFVATVNDSKYGITALQYFQNEITRRNNVFGSNGVKDITGFKAAGNPMPRMLVIIDEFQVLLNDSTVTETAYTSLSDVLKRGRSAGIHVLLATQSLSGLRGSVTGGFETLKTQLAGRLALNCNDNDSRLILAMDNTEATTLLAKQEAILNREHGRKGENVRFNVPFAEPKSCKEHLQDISTRLAQGEHEKTKVFDGAKLPDMPTAQEFSKYAGQIVLGEALNFEAKPFAFKWERKRGCNLCVVGDDMAIRQGILQSVLSSVQHGNMFNRVVYFKADPNFPAIDLTGVELKEHDWDCNIEELMSDLQNKKTLLIINSLDECPREIYPKKKEYTAKATPTTPGDFLKVFLDKGPQFGSFVLAFVDRWGRFTDSANNDYLENFELFVGFCLPPKEAGGVTGDPIGFNEITEPTKAVFVNRKKDEKTMFRPFAVRTEN
jgi:hypothetical protein